MFSSIAPTNLTSTWKGTGVLLGIYSIHFVFLLVFSWLIDIYPFTFRSEENNRNVGGPGLLSNVKEEHLRLGASYVSQLVHFALFISWVWLATNQHFFPHSSDETEFDLERSVFGSKRNLSSPRYIFYPLLWYFCWFFFVECVNLLGKSIWV